jgi:hypothetical protein
MGQCTDRILIVRNAPDLSVDADRGQEPTLTGRFPMSGTEMPYFSTGRIVSVADMLRKAGAGVMLAENGQVARHLGQRQLVA